MKRDKFFLSALSALSVLFFLSLTQASIPCAAAEESPLEKALRGLPGAEVVELKPTPPFVKVYEIMLSQPLDHQKPRGEQFRQRLILSHLHEARPLAIITEGYALGRNYIEELSVLLGASQLRVEHRYFGKSLPAGMKWRYLNLDQAVADYHRIVRLFRPIYRGPRIAAGWSKGGQTALYWRYRYPGDVKATAAYDAPLNFALEEPRIDAFFETVGSPQCRTRLHAFQRMALERKAELLPLLEAYAREKNLIYSVGLEKALEYIVLEYTFSFWQYHHIPCEEIPAVGALAADIFAHLERVVSFWSYSDGAKESPSMYQFCSELGYYGYVRGHLRDLLSGDDYANCDYAPEGVKREYNPGKMRDLAHWLARKGNSIIYIYGDRDPWSAPAVSPALGTSGVAYWLEGGNHFTFIQTFPEPKQKEILSLLRSWLGIKSLSSSSVLGVSSL